MIETKAMTVGLTIIELVVVLVISAILSSIVIPNYTKLQVHAKYSHLKQTAYSIQMAIETFFLYHGVYPDLDSIEALLDLLKQIPLNPFTNNPLSSSDVSGKMTYGFDSFHDVYTIEVFDQGNEDSLLLLSN